MRILLVVSVLLALASGAAAQSRPTPACRGVAELHDSTVEFKGDLFFDDDEDEDSVYTKLRRHFGIRQLARSATVVPIRDVAVCEEWIPAILAAMRSRYGPDHDTEGYLFRMIQYGPYMMVLGGIDLEQLPPGMNVEGTLIPIFLFEAAGKRFLGVMMG